MKKRNVSEEEFNKALMGGITFKKAKTESATPNKVKTKAKKKTYITGQHGTGAAKKKLQIRKQRAKRFAR